MPPPRILITTYHNAYLIRGGGEFEMISVAESLKKRGAIADLYSVYSRSIENYDVVLHFSIHEAGIGLLRAIRAAGKHIVLWPNFWVTDTLPSAELVQEHLDLVETVVFKSQAERAHFSQFFSLPEHKIRVVVAGVDPAFAKPASPDFFRSLYGLKEYAIGFGIIEPVKNQLMAIQALKEMAVPLVLVGKYRDYEYFKACQQAAAKNMLFIDSVPYKSEIACSALQESLFYIEISKEPAGLSALSAGVAGCKMVLSDSDWSREHFGDCATYVDPNSIGSICDGIKNILSQPATPNRITEQMKKHYLPEAIDPLLDILSKVAHKS